MDNKKSSKVVQFFSCELCDYKCCKSYDYNKHLLTRKHKKNKMDNEKSSGIKHFMCNNCDKIYKHQSGLCKHKTKCKQAINGETITIESPSLCEVVKELVQSNRELQNKVLEICKNGINNTTNNNTTNNTNCNNKFNLNFFLNEQCKNAINFKEFVENIEVTREDLANTGQVGFVSGISKILIDQLNELGIHERPIHCTDLKRETLYIKDNNEWNKEKDDVKIRSAIQEVSRKSMGTLIDWKRNNPDYADMESKFSQDCLSMQRNSIAGYERDTLFPRVIRELNRAILVSKETNK